ncbi:MAG: hypothetical protein OEW89_00065 [Gammaproteobacteria bacterium]|nr:hypothetical protein [Gammaproteobacteria bacterium]
MNNKHLNRITISLVKSKKARNLLRGMIGETEHYKVKNTLRKIKNNCSSIEYKKSIEVIRAAELFEHNSVSRDFNKVCPNTLPDLMRFTENEIIDKINSQEDRINKLLHLYRDLLVSIQEMKIRDSLKLCRSIIEHKGVSCCLIRILFYIKNHADDYDDYDDAQEGVEDIFRKIEMSNIGYLDNAIKELSNSRTDYFNICKKINGDQNKTPLNLIARDFISHVTSDEIVFLNTLNAYYTFSLLDSFLYISSVNRLKLPLTKGVKNIKSSLMDSFYSLSNIKVNTKLYLNEYYDDLDINLFRESFLLIELDELFKYKTIHGALYNTSEKKEDVRLPVEKRLLSDYFESIKSLSDLRNHENGGNGISMDKYDSEKCSHFENSSALLYYIEKNDANISGEEKIFIELMSYTRDIGYTCPSHYIKKIQHNADSDELRLVLACLISIKDKSQIADHELRRVMQKLATSKFDSKIKYLVRYLYDISPSVTHHLMQVCDETFLSKLFHLTEKPNKAIEDRADMLEWYGEQIKDLSYIERAKNLRIDVQINKEKGMIDDSRIYVDPLKFTQWINDNILNDITLLLEAKENKNEFTAQPLDWRKVQNGISNDEQIASLLLKCYSEFCNNKLFGIASYLGRRIRHGTFKGTALKEVKDFSSNKKYEDIFNDRDLSDCYNDWLKCYENMLEELKKSYLHIKSKKKPLGLIHSNIGTTSKNIIANHMLHDILKSYNKNGTSLEVPYLVTEYCWRFIEEDLANIRKRLMEYKSKHAVFGFRLNYSRLLKRKHINEFCQELNSVTAEKFRTISSWFNKPSIASPSANLTLLFKAVISEIKGFFTLFEPTIIHKESDFNISGGLYFVIYDALYILIYNAAKYGKENSELEFKVIPHSEHQVINISITSEAKNSKSLAESKRLINAALNADFENAHIEEGKSGIKKLRRMANDQYISNVRYTFPSNKITASFDFSVEF